MAKETQERAKQMHAEFVRFNKAPTLRRVEVDGVPHPDSRDIRQRIFAAGLTYPKKTTGTPLEQQIAAREAELAEKRWQDKINDPKLSLEERDLLRLKKLHDTELDAAEQAERIDRHKQSPRVIQKLTEANLLRQRIVADPARELADIDFADFVLKAISDPDADDTASNALLIQLRETETSRLEQMKLERAAKIAGLQNEIAELERSQVAPAETDDEIEQRAAERAAATKAKFEAKRAALAEKHAQELMAIEGQEA